MNISKNFFHLKAPFISEKQKKHHSSSILITLSMDLFEKKKRYFFLSNFILEKMSLNIEKKSEKKSFFSPFFCLSNMNISKKEKFFLFRNIHFFHFFFFLKNKFL